jgi:DNA modification methylase
MQYMPDLLIQVPSVLEPKDKRPSAKIKAAVSPALRKLDALNRKAEKLWKDKLVLESSLSRSLVSFQANKGRAVYRWYKFKEAFSAGLVEYLFNQLHISKGTLLDPFAGSGTALFAGGAAGLKAEGIELLPIGQTVIQTKQIIDWELQPEDSDRLAYWLKTHPWKNHAEVRPVNELTITRGAYPQETTASIGSYLAAIDQENRRVKAILFFALLCTLESISYTRKDGQYLRWDHRSGRRQGKKPFDKGKILPFDKAIISKLEDIVTDLRSAGMPEDLFGTVRSRAEIVLHSGSCLEVLPRLKKSAYDCIITSPPYCNRYDYTRTYALELALMGVDTKGLTNLRQQMLSCTVENRAKDLLALNPNWKRPIGFADKHEHLQSILAYLESQKELALLNNNGIPRMIRGYFYEMACVVAECARVLKRGSPMMMVNDNVRYAGAIIPVDIILSEFAEQLGFVAEKILVLPNGKGNSSQQMGEHGRESLRKCVYIWRKV